MGNGEAQRLVPRWGAQAVPAYVQYGKVAKFFQPGFALAADNSSVSDPSCF